MDIYRVKFIYIDKQLYCIKQYMIHQVENLITVLNDSHNIILNARKVVKHCSLKFVTEYFSISRVTICITTNVISIKLDPYIHCRFYSLHNAMKVSSLVLFKSVYPLLKIIKVLLNVRQVFLKFRLGIL